MILSQEELKLVKDQEFLLTKIKVTSKIKALLLETKEALKTVLEKGDFPLPYGQSFTSGKISRGENYLGLPYQILDYPASFNKKNVFAFRTMFWWGNFFSVTLHLQGASLDVYRERLIEGFKFLENQDIFIGVGKTPWQYHFGQNNYELLRKPHTGFIEKCDFLKLSKRIDLERWHELPSFSSGFLMQMVSRLIN